MNASIIIDKIDSGELSPSSHRVVRQLCGLLTYSNTTDTDLIAAFDRGEAMNDKRRGPPLWKRIHALPVGQQGALRILSGLLRPDHEIDWEYAEYLIAWAREQGIADEAILETFGVSG